MELIKENKEKHRSVYQMSNGMIRKYWHDKDLVWLTNHAELLKKIVPNYVYAYGENDWGVWMDMNPINGTPANTVPHTKEFVKRIYKFCLENIKSTSPYVHGDWVLSNMFLVGNDIKMCDWDNLGTYPEDEVLKKLHSDMRSAFGNLFDEVLYDSAGI